MILFDYGHTLVHEPEQDYLRGQRRVLELAAENPLGVTSEQLHEISKREYDELFRLLRPLNLETDGLKLDASIYARLRLRFDLPLEEVEYERWLATEPIYPMPGVERFLEHIAALGIRSAVISNLSYSGAALRRRIEELLPNNRFEFILASSESVYRKPGRQIFEAALGMAGLAPEDCYFIGDDVICDIEGAANAGLYPIWFKYPVKCTYKPEPPHPPRCEHLCVSSWEELEALAK